MSEVLDNISVREAKQELAVRKLKSSFRSFFAAFPPSNPYFYGKHTNVLIDTLEQVTFDIEAGKSSYIIVTMPPRHGKSDICSKRWPVWYEIRNPDHEFILASYNYTLASEMSYKSRELMDEVGGLFGISIRQDRGALESWMIEGHKGSVHATGIGGTITGRGAHVLLVDDYFKNREEAESPTMRQKKWESFESDMLTRLAPAHAVVIVANRWHVADIVGKIENKNNPNHEDYDPDFPKFTHLKFPAQNEDTGEWLFPERFSDEWYVAQKAFMGSYAWQAQGLQKPASRGGNVFSVGNIQEVDLDDFPDIKYVRFWDLASTEKERSANSPDYTCGALIGVRQLKNNDVPEAWLKNIVYCREEAPKRDKLILETQKRDGSKVPVFVESVGGYKDAYTTLKKILKGKAMVHKVSVSTDKMVRAAPMEPVIEAGNFYIPKKAIWRRWFIGQMTVFPSGEHDDGVDATSGGFAKASKGIVFQMLNRGSIGL